MNELPPLSRRATQTRSSAIRDLLTITARPDVISLAGGLPDPELVPRERIRRAADIALDDLSTMQYTETPGWAGLRTVLAARESARLGRAIGPAQVLVTHGSQQALSLLGQALLDPGDLVFAEDPAYVGALQVFRGVDARIEAVPLDVDGMRVDVLERRLTDGARPRIVHTVSTFHNPRSVTLAADRRSRLAELADRYGFWVIEDDPYGELWFAAEPPTPVAAHSDRVIRLSSASKILAPALRTGWLVAPEPVCRAVELLKQGADLCGSALTHRITADLLADSDWLAGHLATVRAAYAARSRALTAALRAAFGDRIDCPDVGGGMFCWADFHDGTDTTGLLRAAVEQGVAFVPGSAFAVGDGGGDRGERSDGKAEGYRAAMRLCFTTGTEAILAEAVDRLGAAHACRP